MAKNGKKADLKVAALSPARRETLRKLLAGSKPIIVTPRAI